MITYNLENIVNYAQLNSDVYDVFYQKDLDFLGVLIFIYHKNNCIVEFENDNLNFLHNYMNGLVIQILPSNKYKLLICPEESRENYIYIYRYSEDGFISNSKDNNFKDDILDIIKDIKGYKNFKFLINTKADHQFLSLIKYY